MKSRETVIDIFADYQVFFLPENVYVFLHQCLSYTLVKNLSPQARVPAFCLD